VIPIDNDKMDEVEIKMKDPDDENVWIMG